MSVIWKKFPEAPEQINEVFETIGKSYHSSKSAEATLMSNPFLVYCRFRGTEKFEVKTANLMRSRRNTYFNIIVSGMSGEIEISHYSIFNTPEDILETEDEAKTKKRVIDFGAWYSGMQTDRVERAYERFIREKTGEGEEEAIQA